MTHPTSDLLKEAKLKATPIRKAILNLFANDCAPANAEGIFEVLESEKVNLVTVYRTLAAFEAAGILRRVDLHRDSVYYELASHHHHHIVCTDCGAIESFYACGIARLAESVLADSSGFSSIDQHSLEFFGTCRACARA